MDRRYASFDLHLHSWWSYDACTPPEYFFQRARELKLRAFAVTDHHNSDALPEILKLSKRYPGVGFLAGAEFSAETPYGEMDLICLGLPVESPPALMELREELHRWQRAMGDAISEIVSRIGGVYTRVERRKLLLSYRPEFTLDAQGISHVRNEMQADYLIGKGVVSSREEWYGYLWGSNRIPGLLPSLPKADRVARIVHEAGGLVFVAHPVHYFNYMDEKRIDALHEYIGFDGIECAHPIVPPECTAFYRDYCLRRGLLSSGGTDIHCDPSHAGLHLSDWHEFACHAGEDCWLDEILERLPLLMG